MKSQKLTLAMIGYPLFCLLLFWMCPPLLADELSGEQISTSGNPTDLMIRLGRSHFDPLSTDRTLTSSALVQTKEAFSRMGYYLVQFDGPVRPAWRKALVQSGVEILDYVPDFAFSVRMQSNQIEAVRALAHVRWVGPFQAEYRLSNGALEQLYGQGGKTDSDRVSLKVILFAGSDIGANRAAIEAAGGSIEKINTSGHKVTLQVTIPAGAIDDLSTIEDIKWIEKAPQWRLHNSVSTDIVDARIPRDTYGLYGQNQVVAVSDTGLDTGVIGTLHRDFEDGAGGSRVDQIIDRSGDDASDEHSGHGTHVAGSVLGNGLESGSDPSADYFPDTCYAGLAPKARLVFQALESSAGNLSGIPADLNELFEQARQAGAHLHTNSWGQPTASLYTAGSEDVDQYMWDHKDYLIVYSAGSNGMDMDGDGVVDQFRIESPATAKNCLTVGASEGYQPSGAGLDLNWGDNTTMWQYWFTADPIASGHVSDNYDGMAAISARGPTVDGRTKPDLVAPGSNILSTRSSETAADSLWGAFNDYYAWNGGTSTSAPLTAGAAAVMRQYLMEVEGIATPSAALIKAALINSAEDISPGQYAGEIPQAPSSVAGWGRLNLGNAIHPGAPLNILYYDEAGGLATSESKEYFIHVSDASEPLKLNLVWTDYPGTPANQGGLVNDLDLQVTDPAVAVHYPDQAAQQSTITTISYDSDSYANVTLTYSQAMRFTPSGSDTYLDSVTFAFYNGGANGGADGNVDVVVYPDNGSGRPDTTPGNEIFRKTLSFAPWTMITIPVNIHIGSDDFHIAIEDADTANLGLYIDTAPLPDAVGRSSYFNGSTWEASSVTPYIRANMRSANPSDTFDRVNNVVGITIDTPAVGDYTVRVSGYNVPQGGSQPYALIARGNIVDTQAGTIQFESATFSVSESGGSATITATRTGGSDGTVSVSYTTSNGSASAGSDYATASGTLTWADGDSAVKTFSVTVSDDSSVESDETVNLALSDIIGNAVLGTQNTATLTIGDNDSGGGGSSGGGGGCFIQSLQ